MHASLGAALTKAAPQAAFEIEEHRAKGAGFSDGTGLGSQGRMWPVLSDEALAELVAAYQAGLAAAEALPQARRKVALSRQAAAGSEAAEAICGAMFRLSRQICGDHLRRSRSLSADDLQSAATVAVLDAAARFDPATHESFSAWSAGWVRHAVAREAGRKDVVMPASWLRVGRAAKQEMEDARISGERLDYDQIASRVRATLAAKIESNKQESEASCGSDEQPSTGDASKDAVDKIMRRQGIEGALGRVGYMMSAVGGHVRLDAPELDITDNTESGSTQGDRLAVSPDDVEEQALAGQHPDVNMILFGSSAAEHGTVVAAAREYLMDNTTYEESAREHGVDAKDVRRAVKEARSRAGAPHAHYSHLSGAAAGIVRPAGKVESYGALLAKAHR